MQQKSKLTLDDVIINHLEDVTPGNKTLKPNVKSLSKPNRDKVNINHLEYSILGDAQINLSGVSLGLLKKQSSKIIDEI